MEKRFETVEKRFEAVEERFRMVEKRSETVGKRFEMVERRFETVEKRFETVEKRISFRFRPGLSWPGLSRFVPVCPGFTASFQKHCFYQKFPVKAGWFFCNSKCY